MQKYNRVLSFAIVLLFLVGLWVIIGFINFSNTKVSQSNKNLLPSDIDLTVTLNTQDLLNTFLFDLLFMTDIDENTANLFTPKERDELNKLGADLTSEVLFFYDKWQNESAQGLLFNISNEGDFKRYQTEQEYTIKKSNSNYGVLIYLDEKASQQAIQHFSNVAENIISARKNPLEKELSKSMVNIEYRGSSGDYFKDIKLDLNINNRSILINGKGKLDNKKRPISTPLNIIDLPNSKNYFQIQTGEIPEDAMNYLESTFTRLGIKIPSISSQQLLLYGITIDEINGSTAVLPNLDWVLRMNEPFQIDSVLMNLEPNYKSIVDFFNKTISIGSIKYHYAQISENEIYIGVNEHPKFHIKESQPIYSTSGNPSNLLEIEGQSFIAGFIKMLPLVKYPKQFLENVSYFDIRTEEIKENLTIKGEIKLKEGQLMTVEMVKLWLML